ncbi:hypothetical protein RQP46_000004 [Phenoliferia psychrophenolica]
MATLPSLPPELLAHILDLSNEGEFPEDRQRARFAFGLVARAFYLVTTTTTDFHVEGATQAAALLAKLERERESAAQEERRATLSIRTRVSNVRHLSVVLDTDSEIGTTVFFDLLLATDDLITLHLDAPCVTALSDAAFASLEQLEPALIGLTSLRELKICSMFFDAAALLRILIPLKALEVLALPIIAYKNSFWEAFDDPNMDLLALPRLREVRIRLSGGPDAFTNTLLDTLAADSTRIKVLDLQKTRIKVFSTKCIDPLLPHVANLHHFTWLPESSPSVEPPMRSARDAVLTLLGAMKNLRSINIAIHWTRTQSSRWTREQRGRVKEAAEAAGVTFSYPEGTQGVHE